jgi:hypothetical protein
MGSEAGAGRLSSVNPLFRQACSAAARYALVLRAVRGVLALVLFVATGAARADCLWNSGAFDHRTAQTSVVGQYGEQETADDIYIQPQQVCRVDRITVTLIGDSIIPKARLRIYDDCNGAPGNQLYTLDSTQFTDTGQVYSGFRVFTVEFDPVNLWLQGGPLGKSFWVSVMGVAATPNDLWYWGSAGGGSVVIGLPGKYRFVSAGMPNWTSVADLGCGCTDFMLKIDGECCGILWDGGGPDPAVVGASSIITGASGGSFDTRAADDFNTPTCRDVTVCYLQAVMYSNCSPMRGRFEIYANDCQLPTGTPLFTAAFSYVRDLGYAVTIGGTSLRAYQVELYDPGWVLPAGKIFWLSAVGQGGGSLQQKAYFAISSPVCSVCSTKLNSAAAQGPAISGGVWAPLSQTLGQPRDLSFVIGVRDYLGQGAGLPTCPGDFNHDGVINSQDIFDFLTAWFSGCP